MLARQIAIGFGIALVFPLLIYYGVSTFHHAPQLRDYEVKVDYVQNPTAEKQKEIEAQKNERDKKYAEFRTAAKEFSRILILVSTPLGVAAILIGAYLKYFAIGTGLILGGILSLGWGYFSYWDYLDDWIRFVSLLIGFVILLFVGYRRVGQRAEP